MATRLHLVSGERTWSAEVTGDRVRLDGAEDAVVVSRQGARLTATDTGRTTVGAAAVSGDAVWVSVEGEVFEFRLQHGTARSRTATRDHDAFTPPMSATVVRIAVTPGDHVRDGDLLIALEAMKMELPIRAPRDGIVSAVHCQEGELVQPGDVLVDLD
jgi:3-methylcrotonyl-CoA carboxylase alpha subunit